MTKRIRVLLADDHGLVRSAVRADLEQEGFEVCAEADTADAALIQAMREQPDICLLDIRMPGGGLLAAWDITDRLPGTKVVMLTMSKSDEHIVAAFRAGAVGYVLKDVDGSQLADLIKAYVGGDVTLSAALAKRLVDDVAPVHAERRRLLRKKNGNGNGDGRALRDRELFGLFGDGLTFGDVADRLGVSETTVRSELSTALAGVRYADRTSIAALSSLNT